MDEQFKKLLAPRRSSVQQANSLLSIKRKVKMRARFQRLQVIGTTITTVALLLIIFTMFISNPATVPNHAATSVTLHKAYHFSNFGEEPVANIDKWYYTSKTNIKNGDLRILADVAEKTMRSTQLYEGNSLPSANRDFLLFYEDGSKQYLQFWTMAKHDRHEQFVMDAATKQVYELTNAESTQLQKLSNDSQIILDSINFIIFMFVVYAAVLVCLRLNLLRNTEYFSRVKAWKIFALSFGIYIYTTIIKGFSLYYFGAMNGLFIGSLLFLPFVLYHWRQLGKSTYQVSSWVLPIVALVITYYVFVLI